MGANYSEEVTKIKHAMWIKAKCHSWKVYLDKRRVGYQKMIALPRSLNGEPLVMLNILMRQRTHLSLHSLLYGLHMPLRLLETLFLPEVWP
jgi:hypothetical protein